MVWSADGASLLRQREGSRRNRKQTHHGRTDGRGTDPRLLHQGLRQEIGLIAKKKDIKQEIRYGIDFEDVEGDIDCVIKRLAEIKKYYESKGYTKLRIEVDRWYSDTEIKLYGIRLETDKEQATRLKNEKAAREKKRAQKKKQEEAERKKLRELAKKYPEEI